MIPPRLSLTSSYEFFCERFYTSLWKRENALALRDLGNCRYLPKKKYKSGYGYSATAAEIRKREKK
jgi:hypothetical protein